jgi:hypothetical protein
VGTIVFPVKSCPGKVEFPSKNSFAISRYNRKTRGGRIYGTGPINGTGPIYGTEVPYMDGGLI